MSAKAVLSLWEKSFRASSRLVWPFNAFTNAAARIDRWSRLSFAASSMDAMLFLSFAGDRDIVAFNVDKATRIMVDEFKAEPVGEQELVEGWWDSKHRLEFIPFKQKWPDAQKTKKFGAADPGVPVGRLEEFYHKFVEIAEKHKLEIIGMNAYLEHPNSIGFSLSCAVFVDYRSADEVGDSDYSMTNSAS